MASSGLLQQINYTKPYREKRLNAGLWVIDHPESMPEMVAYSFDPGFKRSMQALWGLEFICRIKLELFYPHLDAFFNYLPTVKEHNILRALSFICELVSIAYYKKRDPVLGDGFTQKHKTVMTECCFDWLITRQKVACQVRAMTALYFLGTEFEWLHPELQQIIQQNIHQGSAGYEARGRHTLEKINRFKS